MDILLNILVSFGLVAVSLCFVILLPVVSKTLIGVFSIVMGEQTFSRFRKVESGSVIRRVDNPPPVEPKTVDDIMFDAEGKPRIYQGKEITEQAAQSMRDKTLIGEGLATRTGDIIDELC